MPSCFINKTHIDEWFVSVENDRSLYSECVAAPLAGLYCLQDLACKFNAEHQQAVELRSQVLQLHSVMHTVLAHHASECIH